MISATGEVYKTYNRGPRTDPCSTPQLSSRKEDCRIKSSELKTAYINDENRDIS